MISRRGFLGAVAAGAAGNAWLSAAEPAAVARKKLAVLTTVWTYHSHAWHMAERFLHGYPIQGKWHRPELDVVAAYVDQKPESDLSRARAEEFGSDLSHDCRGTAARRRQTGCRCR